MQYCHSSGNSLLEKKNSFYITKLIKMVPSILTGRKLNIRKNNN